MDYFTISVQKKSAIWAQRISIHKNWKNFRFTNQNFTMMQWEQKVFIFYFLQF